MTPVVMDPYELRRFAAYGLVIMGGGGGVGVGSLQRNVYELVVVVDSSNSIPEHCMEWLTLAVHFVCILFFLLLSFTCGTKLDVFVERFV